MSPELEHKLIEKYPALFKDRHRPPTESLMCFGCEFSDGWYNIFSDLCEYLEMISDYKDMVKLKPEYHTPENHGYMHVKRPSISFTQVKEKYGTMRVYWIGNGVDGWEEIKEKLDPSVDTNKIYDRYYEKIENAIDYVSFLSGKTCEECGEPGKVYTNGWYMCRCKKCIVDRYGFDPDEDLKEDEEIVKL